MVSREVPENPPVTTHKYCRLRHAKLFKFGDGTRKSSLITELGTGLTLCVLARNPFCVELPAIVLQGEQVSRSKRTWDNSHYRVSEAVLTPQVGFDAKPAELGQQQIMAGPACLQAKGWLRHQETDELIRVKYFWPSKRLRDFFDPNYPHRTRNLKRRNLEDYKSAQLNHFGTNLFKLTLFCLGNSGSSWKHLLCPPLSAQPQGVYSGSSAPELSHLDSRVSAT